MSPYCNPDQELNDVMRFGRVVVSDGRGNVTEPIDTEYGPDMVYAIADEDGQLVKDPATQDFYVDMCGYGDWELLRGFTGQCGYSGALMHPSECIGGALESHIRENAGYYVAVMVDLLPDDEDSESEMDSWAVAFKAFDA